ncbi:MAG: GDP-mannose 4,6-dehydratase, partial [Lachnospiraceae bacterium]|nr:GDP-mannose 4,6-dehydratase [Lachnospiraceae bacterium]
KLNIRFSVIDLMDKEALKSAFATFRPDYCLHLAAFSSVAYSWKYPSESFTNNSNIFLNLIDAIRETDASCRVLSVGSSEEYGNVSRSELPLKESQRVNPVSPYAVARVSQELMSKVYVKAYGMNVIMTRSFNHIGPRQDDRFVIPSFIKRIIDIKKSGKDEGEIETGDTSIIRDFVDVRDVVRAYYMLLENGTPGEIYNICSGNAYRLADIIDGIAAQVGVKVTTKVNPEFVRPDDNKEIVGSAYKIESELGWKPVIDIKDTLRDMIAERS